MISSELQTFKSKVVSDDSSNGGRMSSDLVTSGEMQNVWPHVPKALRDLGNENANILLAGQDRKLFDKVSNDDDEALMNPGYYLDHTTLGEDWAIFAPVGQRDTQADWRGGSAPSRWYGVGYLKDPITAGVTTTITVVMKDASISGTIGLANETVRISDKDTPTSVSGNEDIVTVNGSAPVVSDNEVTFTLTSAPAASYAANSKVSAVYEPGVDVEATIDNKDITGVAGDGDLDITQVILDSIGTDEQTVTITFTGATTFTVACDDATGAPSGSTGSEYSFTNADFTKPRFTIPAVAWSGTFANGDVVIFQTHPAAVPLVQKRVIPINCASLANNRIRKATMGESPS